MRTSTLSASDTNKAASFSELFFSLKKYFSSLHIASFAFENFQRASVRTSSFSRNGMQQFKKKMNKNSLLAIFGVVFVGLILFMIISFFRTDTKSSIAQNSKVTVKKANGSHMLNKSFTFKVKDNNGKDTNIKFLVENAELRDEIIVKGHQATAVSGRTFLIVNLRITNDSNTPVEMQAKDYVRLTTNNSSDKLAPDINNDPVQIQAISTKPTRVGFPINTTDKDLVLQVGEITGRKDEIQLTFTQ